MRTDIKDYEELMQIFAETDSIILKDLELKKLLNAEITEDGKSRTIDAVGGRMHLNWKMPVKDAGFDEVTLETYLPFKAWYDPQSEEIQMYYVKNLAKKGERAKAGEGVDCYIIINGIKRKIPMQNNHSRDEVVNFGNITDVTDKGKEDIMRMHTLVQLAQKAPQSDAIAVLLDQEFLAS